MSVSPFERNDGQNAKEIHFVFLFCTSALTTRRHLSNITYMSVGRLHENVSLKYSGTQIAK